MRVNTPVAGCLIMPAFQSDSRLPGLVEEAPRAKPCPGPSQQEPGDGFLAKEGLLCHPACCLAPEERAQDGALSRTGALGEASLSCLNWGGHCLGMGTAQMGMGRFPTSGSAWGVARAGALLPGALGRGRLPWGVHGQAFLRLSPAWTFPWLQPSHTGAAQGLDRQRPTPQHQRRSPARAATFSCRFLPPLTSAERRGALSALRVLLGVTQGGLPDRSLARSRVAGRNRTLYRGVNVFKCKSVQPAVSV